MNKRISKILISTMLVLVLALSLVCFVACDNNPPVKQPKKEKSISITLGDKTIDYTTKKDCIFDVLVDLTNEKKISDFTYTSTVSIDNTDAFVTAIGDLKPAYGTHEYIAFYHTFDDVTLKDMSDWALPNEVVGDTTYYYSSVGAKLLPIEDGASYLFLIKSY